MQDWASATAAMHWKRTLNQRCSDLGPWTAAMRTLPTFTFLASLTQHRFASAARLWLRRGASRQSGRSQTSISPKPRPHFRCEQVGQARRGQTGLVQLRIMLTQKALVCTAEAILPCGTHHRTGPSNGVAHANFKRPIRCAKTQESHLYYRLLPWHFSPNINSQR